MHVRVYDGPTARHCLYLRHIRLDNLIFNFRLQRRQWQRHLESPYILEEKNPPPITAKERLKNGPTGRHCLRCRPAVRVNWSALLIVRQLYLIEMVDIV